MPLSFKASLRLLSLCAVMFPMFHASASILQVGDQYVATAADSSVRNLTTGAFEVDSSLRDLDFSNSRIIETVDTSTLTGFSSGDQIRITRLGIAGDADASSGPAAFGIVGDAGTPRVTFSAGQPIQVPTVDYFLGVTPATNSSGGRGFTYADVDILLAVDEGFTLDFLYQYDPDGRYAFGTDLLGNSFDDFAEFGVTSTVRGWVQFEIVSSSVPAPATILILVLGLLGVGRRISR